MTFATSNRITLHYRTNGQGGPALVFLNSLGTDLHTWDMVAELFPDVQTVQYDKRGHGLSDAPARPYSFEMLSLDLKGLLDQLELEQAVLIGVSVGGMIALDFAGRFPEMVLGMVLCDTAAKIGTEESWNQRIAALDERGMGSMVDPILDRWFAPGAPDALRQVGHNMLSRLPVEGYIGVCTALRDGDLRPQVPTLTMPALVLCGAQDSATTPELVQTLADTLPNATFELIDNAGHLPGWEQPEATAEAIRRFLMTHQLLAEPEPSKFDRGMAIRRSVLGDAHVDRATTKITPFDADFQRFITEFAWGTVWAGETLPKTTRHMVTLAILAALGKEHEFAMHVKATLQTGVTPDELKEVLHHVAIYAGVPAANTAIGIAKKFYAEQEKNSHE